MIAFCCFILIRGAALLRMNGVRGLRRAIFTLLATSLVFGGAAEARDLSPLEFVQRFLTDPGQVFRGNQPLQRHPRPEPKAASAAAETPLVDVPLPHLRPSDDTTAALGYQAAEGVVAISTNEMPTPRLRPDDLSSTPTAQDKHIANDIPGNTQPDFSLADAPPPKVAEKAPAAEASERPTITPPEKPTKLASLSPVPLPTPAPPITPKLIRPPPAATSVCGMAIAQLGVIATPLAEIDEGECGVAEPVKISALDGGKIKIAGEAIVDCHVAEQLANWVKDTVVPNVRDKFNDELTSLRVVDSYTCRTRDNIEGAKLSEHAHGNAIDIGAFRVGQRWIEVGPGWRGGGEDLAFLGDVRKAACGQFTTVLGPGSDSFHTDHFHLDMIKRRTAGPSKGLYCK